MKALIIAEPWIGRVLACEKTWEVRSRDTRVRGRIGLIRKGSGTVVGVAELVGRLPKLPISKLRANTARHGVRAEEIGDDFKWDTAWVLDRARPLSAPVPYPHPAGAVIWVNLDPKVTAIVEERMKDA